jgi:hypothetical protein
MPNDQPKKRSENKENPMPKDSFVDDLLWVTTETLSPTAEPAQDPMPGEGEK